MGKISQFVKVGALLLTMEDVLRRIPGERMRRWTALSVT